MFDSASLKPYSVPDGILAAGRERLAACWWDDPGRFWSLLVMLKFNAAPYMEICTRLQALESEAEKLDDNARRMRIDKRFASSTGLLHSMIAPCEDLDLEQSLKLLFRLIESIRTQSINYNDYQGSLGELRRRIVDELDSRHCFYLEQEKAKFYDVANAFGDEVAAVFPAASIDIEEAGKCLALGRNTACVFHLMRTTELGMRALADWLGVPHDFKTWDPIIKKMRTEVDNYNASTFKGNLDFIRQTLERLTGVQLALRNETMHARSFYDSERAEDIYRAVRTFMQQLAAELKTKP